MCLIMSIAKPIQEEINFDVTSSIETKSPRIGGVIKIFDLVNVNNNYIEAFRKAKYPLWETNERQKASWVQYKSNVGRFLEMVDKDAVTIEQADIDNYLKDVKNENTRTNRKNFIRSFLSYILSKNVSFSRQRANMFVLIYTDTVPLWFLKDKNIIKRLTVVE